MKEDHAHVHVDGMDIPLIGIAKEQTDDRCEGCGQTFHIQTLTWIGTHLLCPKCQQTTKTQNEVQTVR